MHVIHPVIPNTEADFTDVITLLIELHAEGGYAPFNLEKAARGAYEVIEEGMTWLAKDGEELLGVLGLTELSFWYSDLTFLTCPWFYVRPDHRFGNVGVDLLRCAKDEADLRGLICFIDTNNPRRRAKGGSWLTVAGERAGYIPAGYMLRVSGGRHGQQQDQANNKL